MSNLTSFTGYTINRQSPHRPAVCFMAGEYFFFISKMPSTPAKVRKYKATPKNLRRFLSLKNRLEICQQTKNLFFCNDFGHVVFFKDYKYSPNRGNYPVFYALESTQKYPIESVLPGVTHYPPGSTYETSNIIKAGHKIAKFLTAYIEAQK